MWKKRRAQHDGARQTAEARHLEELALQRHLVADLMVRTGELPHVNRPWHIRDTHVGQVETLAAHQGAPPVQREADVKNRGSAVLVLRLCPKARLLATWLTEG